jgi:imidazolonepropionase-like amidohydrolase
MYMIDEKPATDCMFRNVTLIDGTGAEPVLHANVLVQNGKIVNINTREDAESVWCRENPELKVIQADGMYLLPGLMDAHLHVHGYANTDPTVVKLWHLTTNPTFKMFHAVKNLSLLLEAGFTAVRHCGIMTYDLDNCLRDAVAAELFPGPRVLTCGHDISMTAGHGDLFTPPWAVPISGDTADGVDECVKAVRARLRQGADFIKIHSGGGVMSEGDPIWWRNYSIEEIRAICDEAHAFRRKVAAHAHGTEGIKVALRGGVDSIEHGSLMDDEGREMMLEKEAYLVPTLATTGSIIKNGLKTGAPPASIEKGKFMYAKAQENFKKAYRMG